MGSRRVIRAPSGGLADLMGHACFPNNRILVVWRGGGGEGAGGQFPQFRLRVRANDFIHLTAENRLALAGQIKLSAPEKKRYGEKNLAAPQWIYGFKSDGARR